MKTQGIRVRKPTDRPTKVKGVGQASMMTHSQNQGTPVAAALRRARDRPDDLRLKRGAIASLHQTLRRRNGESAANGLRTLD